MGAVGTAFSAACRAWSKGDHMARASASVFLKALQVAEGVEVTTDCYPEIRYAKRRVLGVVGAIWGTEGSKAVAGTYRHCSY